MSDKTEKIKIRIIAPVLLVILLIAIIAVVIIQRVHSERVLSEVTSNITKTYSFMQESMAKQTELLSSLNSKVRHDPNLQRAWQEKDRQKLLEFARPVFDEIAHDYKVTNLSFIGLDKKCLLRAHAPSHYGDNINRFTLEVASASGERGAGIELVPMGTLTLRVVYPWKIKGKHVGYIEVGQEVEHIINDISELLHVKLIMGINTSMLDKSLWPAEEPTTGHAAVSDGVDRLIAISTSIKNIIPSEWNAYIAYMRQHNHTNYTPAAHVTSGKHIFSAGFVPLFDAGGRDIGDMLVISESLDEQKEIEQFTFILVLSATVMTLLLGISFYRYIDGIEQKLRVSRQELMAESEAREETLLHARDVAEQTNRMKSEFLANMSHEIRTPMNGVMGTLQLLNDTSLTEDQRKYTEIALKSSELLVTLLNDILDLSKIESGKLVFEEIPYDIRTTLEDVTESLYESASRKGLELYCLMGANIPVRVTGDPFRLRQVLSNLISNAIKFTQQGKIIVRLETSVDCHGQSMLLFEVSDTGIGIPEEAQGSIFKSFVQADGSTTRVHGGTGLGLTISKKIIEQLGGEIQVKSTLDMGSTFSFTMPMRPAEMNEAEEMPFQKINGQRLLLLNSTSEMAKVISNLGLRVERVGEDSVSLSEYVNGVLDRLESARVAGDPFSIAVLEQCGGSDAYVIAEAIRANKEQAGTRLVLLTALGHRGDGDVARRAGFDGFLTKPIRQAVMYDCFATILGFERHNRKTMVTSHSLRECHNQEEIHVLLVEDDEVSQIVICAMLQKQGYHVGVATNGLEALKALNNTSYQLILMDCQMPEMDGYDATQAIRKNEAWKDIPVIALTANALAGDREKCIAAGMDEYLTKPVEHEVLVKLLQRVLEGTNQN